MKTEIQRGTGMHESAKSSAEAVSCGEEKQRCSALQETGAGRRKDGKGAKPKSAAGNLARLLAVNGSLTHGHGAAPNSGCNF